MPMNEIAVIAIVRPHHRRGTQLHIPTPRA